MTDTLQHTMHTLDKSGDLKVMWDKDNEDEIAAAQDVFDDLRGKGYLAYKAQGRKGEKGEQIREFDPDAERIVLVKPHAGG
jgi:hypothetical protein